MSALGRLHPGEGVVDLAAAPGERLASLNVTEGDEVGEGEVLGFLGSYEALAAEVAIAEAELREAELAAQRVRELGPLEIASLEAEVKALAAEARQRSSELERHRSLLVEGISTEQDLDLQVSVAERAQQELERAEIELERRRKDRELEQLETEAGRESAESRLAAARARLQQNELISPISGRVLKIFTWPGEIPGSQPILRLGHTQSMYAVTEVDETDVRWIRLGQRATITSPALQEPIMGTVGRIGSIIHRNEVFDLDPTALADTRVIEVRVRLDDSELASKLVHHQVLVTIDVRDPQDASQ